MIIGGNGKIQTPTADPRINEAIVKSAIPMNIVTKPKMKNFKGVSPTLKAS